MDKILIVEDVVAIGESLKAWLQTERHRVEVVRDGLSAKEYLRSYEYDPGSDFKGKELSARIRALLRRPAAISADVVQVAGSRLRKKLKRSGRPQLIETVHGLGYKFVPPQ